MTRSAIYAWALAALSSGIGGPVAAGEIEDALDSVRLNQIQVIGSHNSYHLRPQEPEASLVRQSDPKQAAALEYEHRPLAEQFGRLGIRQIELDLFHDPEGGRYAKPRALMLQGDRAPELIRAFDPEGKMKRPGLKVIHVQDIDFRSTVPTFRDALEAIDAWSRANPHHVPIAVLLELKSSTYPLLTEALPFDAAALDGLDAEIRSVFGPERLVTPDGIRGAYATPRAAIEAEGWPLLNDVRGKVVFLLDNTGDVARKYATRKPKLEGRVALVDLGPDDPRTLFRKLNDVKKEFDEIQTAVRAGYLVRTRADRNTAEARENDTTRRDRALASGAHFVSTDYPEPNRDFSDYRVRLPNGVVARPNPLVGPQLPAGTDLDENP